MPYLGPLRRDRLTSIIIAVDLAVCLIYTIYMFAIKRLITKVVKDFDADSV